ncbi:zf-CCHC domain-containing protein [Gossypium australe]|uniref:Zf-CCHC domain-containing protein n=1 Tax=Gossypium australe TaxID=47621 RepID=A0A5B6VLU7_9ROSI|nr:zf-CCHC domain-containing protein [Gossypium australe]
MEMLARRFKRFMRSSKGREFEKKEGLKLESSKEKDPIICYKCKKLGHIKYDCPQLKNKGSSKQKAYVAAWSDEDSFDDEVANLCLMAINDPKEKLVKSVWVPKELSDTQDKEALSKWIPKGTRILQTNDYGPKRYWVPKT